MTTAQRREEILALLNQADAPIAAKDLAARFGVSRQVIVQDLAVIRASRPNIISTNRGYILQQQETGCLRSSYFLRSAIQLLSFHVKSETSATTEFHNGAGWVLFP